MQQVLFHPWIHRKKKKTKRKEKKKKGEERRDEKKKQEKREKKNQADIFLIIKRDCEIITISSGGLW